MLEKGRSPNKIAVAAILVKEISINQRALAHMRFVADGLVEHNMWSHNVLVAILNDCFLVLSVDPERLVAIDDMPGIGCKPVRVVAGNPAGVIPVNQVALQSGSTGEAVWSIDGLP